MTNPLFICSRNRLRSPTAEAVFAAWPGVETASAGLALPLSHWERDREGRSCGADFKTWVPAFAGMLGQVGGRRKSSLELCAIS